MMTQVHNKFSWKRVWQFGMIYRRRILVQTVSYVVLLALCALILAYVKNGWLFMPVSFLSLLLLVFSPVVFDSRDQSFARNVPALKSEKLTFYLLYSLVYIPIVVKLLDLILVCAVGKEYVTGLFLDATQGEVMTGYRGMVYTSALIYIVAAIMSVLTAVLTWRKNALLGAILYFLVAFVINGFVPLVFGFIAGYHDAVTGVDETVIQQGVMYKYFPTICVITITCHLLWLAYLIRRLYKRF